MCSMQTSKGGPETLIGRNEKEKKKVDTCEKRSGWYGQQFKFPIPDQLSVRVRDPGLYFPDDVTRISERPGRPDPPNSTRRSNNGWPRIDGALPVTAATFFKLVLFCIESWLLAISHDLRSELRPKFCSFLQERLWDYS